jgi:hypothetical protein
MRYGMFAKISTFFCQCLALATVLYQFAVRWVSGFKKYQLSSANASHSQQSYTNWRFDGSLASLNVRNAKIRKARCKSFFFKFRAGVLNANSIKKTLRKPRKPAGAACPSRYSEVQKKDTIAIVADSHQACTESFASKRVSCTRFLAHVRVVELPQ